MSDEEFSWDYDTVSSKNAENVKALGEGDSAELWADGRKVLIGQGHPQEYYDAAGSFEHGSVTKTKKAGGLGGLLDHGTLTVAGASNQSEITSHLGGFSKKKVIFS